MGPFKDHNRYIVENARAWVVAITDEELAAVSERVAAQPDQLRPTPTKSLHLSNRR
jgi:hypothetical protein